ncbi:hypothetical protein CC78DRAFT_550367 [Lojkania enalia]|uniref:Zn(2)-C6 fungal-type domain-containing protein n=1 Tax=Lojkania enalia TaxID=147567 RepID=A0A9P4NB99_9PLEO|nr:hypothetical protein CC78DRAFT_550367 [Didymosphaeria enalia]
MTSIWTNFSVGVQGDKAGPQAIGEGSPACASCRKRKLRCSRDAPKCSQCKRLSTACIYNPKQKPGLKSGALEALTRRVGGFHPLEYEQSRQRKSTDPATTNQRSRSVTSLPGVNNVYEAGAENDSSLLDGDCLGDTRKRKIDHKSLVNSVLELNAIDIANYLPSQPLLQKLVDYFCISFHHWIPYLHKQRLQTSASAGSRSAGLNFVFHSLVAATLRHINREDLFLDEDEVLQQTRISRFILNSGEPSKAWPLIGSLTRTVGYLQLTLEPSASQSSALMNPLQLVEPTDDWTELEERRRLFWVIFLLDRFCSVTTGWNTSLTSEDVHRRLPADGGYFTREEPVTTPYFGIWNKTAARIGKSLAHVPAQYNEDDPVLDQVQGVSPGSASGVIDSSKLGAFAYCVEATESLSQVTTFFLQQRINWQDNEHTINWLTRFKELDLRLVQWKLFLPRRWKDSDISPDTQVVDMDPNLTLAHITHNTSMILLHHSIAYPPRGWNAYVALPKECSAQTCEHAAVETCNIVEKFLTHRAVFVNAQFAFCAFVAAKALLFESQAKHETVRPEFERLLQSLWEMSARWAEPAAAEKRKTNQAGKYALHLRHLHENGQKSRNFTFEFYDHSCQNVNTITTISLLTPMESNSRGKKDRRQSAHVRRARNSTSSSFISGNPTNISHHPAFQNARYATNGISPDTCPSIVPPHPALPSTQHTPRWQHQSLPSPDFSTYPQTMYSSPTNTHTARAPEELPMTSANGDGSVVQDDSLLSLSDAFMDSHFLGLDRVITFEDANFFLPSDGFRW